MGSYIGRCKKYSSLLGEDALTQHSTRSQRISAVFAGGRGYHSRELHLINKTYISIIFFYPLRTLYVHIDRN